MWINYIGEIGAGLFILLIALHFVQHFRNKAELIKKRKLKQAQIQQQKPSDQGYEEN